MALTVVIAYDISEDKRRARVAALLQQWGNRVQRSVFVCELDPTQLAEVHRRVGDIIEPGVDSVYAFRQCAACWEHVGVLGQATVAEDPLYWSVM